MEVLLILDSGTQKGRETNLARGIYLVGRSRICQIRPKNRYVSRKHCAIIHRNREVLIQDLGSKTGTYINRVRIDPKVATVLSDGDKIRVGKTKFRLSIVAPVALSDSGQLLGSDEHNDDEIPHQTNMGPVPSEESETATAAPHDISSVLRMLEEDDEEDDAESPDYLVPGSVFQLTSKGSDVDVDDDDSDGNVVFAAPQCGESLGAADPLPSYSSRKDWDVKSVYSWIEQKETFARLDARRTKRSAKTRIQNAETETTPAEAVPDTTETYTARQREAQVRVAASKAVTVTDQKSWIDKLDSDSVRPIVLVVVGVGFAAWFGWNVWLLISFKG